MKPEDIKVGDKVRVSYKGHVYEERTYTVKEVFIDNLGFTCCRVAGKDGRLFAEHPGFLELVYEVEGFEV